MPIYRTYTLFALIDHSGEAAKVGMTIAADEGTDSRLQQARQLLAPICGWFNEGFGKRSI